ncbi:MAG: ABC transporter substrate-binding protein, partial [Pseudoruegeria sp.]
MKQKTNLVAMSLLASTVALGAQAQDNAVTVVLSEELEIVEPCSSTKSNVGRVLFQNISETVTEMDPHTGLQPRLAESWEDMGDGTWRFTLREGVTFSDGSVMNAEDVAHSLVRMKSPDIACEIGAKFFGGIDITTNIVDDLTIDV